MSIGVRSVAPQPISVENDMERVIRTMVLINRPESFAPGHEYVGKAAELRPDRAGD
jgi:chorismate mutase